MTRALLLAALLLSACSGPFAERRGPTTPYRFGDKGELVDFSYAWSAEATAIPALDQRMRAMLDKAWRAELAAAIGDRAAAVRAKSRYAGHQYAFEWITAGQSRRLLSLEGLSTTFSGTAHPDHNSAALLWDRRSGTAVTSSSLFAYGGGLPASVRATYCAALDRERAKRRKGNAVTGKFAACPRLSDLTVVPADSDADARFDRLRLTTDPEVAGPYAEGFYQVDVGVSRAFIAALKPAYRSSFEVGQPQ